MIFYPKKYFNNILEITYDFLLENNIKGIILDVDNTLIDFEENILEGAVSWCKDLKQNGIKFFIVSNSNKKTKLEKVSKEFELDYILFAKKPFRKAFLTACDKMELAPKNVAAIGDQVFTDVIGANRGKLFSILVHPLDEKDIFITVIKRPFENYILKRYFKKEGKK